MEHLRDGDMVISIEFMHKGINFAQQLVMPHQELRDSTLKVAEFTKLLESLSRSVFLYNNPKESP